MRMDKSKNISSEAMRNVTGGTAVPVSAAVNYTNEQKVCPGCGSNRLVYSNIAVGDGVHGMMGQRCTECGEVWSFGSKTSIL